MSIYNNKHVVFEQVGLDADRFYWNTSSNTDDDGASNDWNISDMRNTTLPARLLLLSQLLQDNLSNTTVQTAKNGNSSTLVSTSDKLFIAAQKEMTTIANLSRTEENNVLTTWNYYVSHSNNSDRVKYDSTSTARPYWLRSPRSDYNDRILYISNSGGTNTTGTFDIYRVSPCFAF